MGKSTITTGVGSAGVSVHIRSDIPRPSVAEGEAHVHLSSPIVAAPRSTSKRENWVNEFYSDCRSTSTVHSIGPLTGAYPSNPSRTLVTASAHHHKKNFNVNSKGSSTVPVGLTTSAVAAPHGTALGTAKAGGRPESPPANDPGSLPNMGATTHTTTSVVSTTRGAHESHIAKSCKWTNTLPSIIAGPSGTLPHGYGRSSAPTGTTASVTPVTHSPVNTGEKHCASVCMSNISSSVTTTTAAGHLLHVATATCLLVNMLTD